jgi:S1-C subfamily serine protease
MMRTQMKIWQECACAALVALGLVAAAITGTATAKKYYYSTHASPLDAVMKVEMTDGHGSGVHLGGGLILTARHVVVDNEGEFEEDIKVRDASGFSSDAKVLWVSKDYDAALLKTSYAGPAAPLRCTGVGMGEGIAAAGSPGDLNFITTYGHTASAGPMSMKRSAVGDVEVITMDLNAGQGMSGGPIFDAQHRVIGIVSMITNPKNLGGSFTFAIPATNICRLLAR